MADDQTKQPVVEATPSAAVPAPAAKNDAPDMESLDSLLNQYAEATKAPAAPAPVAAPVKPEATPSNALADQVKRLADAEERRIKAAAELETKNELESAVKVMRGDLPDNPVIDKIIRGYIKDTADGDPRLVKAFNERAQNPAAWEKIKASLGKQFQKDFADLQRKPDAAATEDREVVTAALRGASTTPPPAKEPNVAKMTNAELRKHNREKFGYEPNF